MNERLGTILLMAVLMGATLACGLSDDVQDTVKTVDEAVALLQDIKDSGTWTTVSDGLDELDNQDEGYALTIHLRDGDTNDADEMMEPPVKDVIMVVRVDAHDHATIQLVENDQTRTYFVEDYRTSLEGSPVYQIKNGRYICVQDDEAERLFRNGPGSAFEAYAITATGVQWLSVAQENDDGDETIAGRDASRYDLESRVPDAQKILERFDNKELQARVDAAGAFELTGTLYLDQETLALVRFESIYDDTAHHRRTEFLFEITEWGSTPDILAPSASEIDLLCH
jgi:hypothetical protein